MASLKDRTNRFSNFEIKMTQNYLKNQANRVITRSSNKEKNRVNATSL